MLDRFEAGGDGRSDHLDLPPPPESAGARLRRSIGGATGRLRESENRVFWIGLAVVLAVGLILMVAASILAGGIPYHSSEDGRRPTLPEGMFLIGMLPWAMVLVLAATLIYVFGGLLILGTLLALLLVGIEAICLRITRGRWVRPNMPWDGDEPPTWASSEPPPRDRPADRRRRRDPHGHYAALGLDPRASNRMARHVYRRLALRHHPDRGGDLRRMQRINAAWDVIGDPVRRAAYDRIGCEAERT